MARLTAQDWTDAALMALAEQGPKALSVEPLARRLKVTKGSFYHHFQNRKALQDAVLDRFTEASTEAIIARTDAASDAPWGRLEALMHTVFTPDPTHERIESAMRAWAAHAPEVAEVMARIDTRRVRYVADLLVKAGQPREVADSRSGLLYRVLIGEATWAAAGGPRLGTDDLRQLARMLGAPGDRPPPIPNSPDEVTADWLTRALRSGGLQDAVVDSVSVEPVDGEGLTAQVRRLRLTGTAPQTLILKLARPEPRWFADACAEVQVTELLAAADSPLAPRCRFARTDARTRRAVLLLDDAPGHHPRSGLSAADLDRLLHQLAAHHSSWWDSPRLDALGRPRRHVPEARLAECCGRLAARWHDLVDGTPPPGLDRIRDTVEALLPTLPSVIRLLDAGPRTLVHRDLHVDNLLVHPDRITVLDWSEGRPDHPLKDLAWVLGTAAATDTLADAPVPWLVRYHHLLGPLLPFEALVRGWAPAMLWLVCTEARFLADHLARHGRLTGMVAAHWDRLRDAAAHSLPGPHPHGLCVAQLQMGRTVADNLPAIEAALEAATDPLVLFPELALTGFHAGLPEVADPVELERAVARLDARVQRLGRAAVVGSPWRVKGEWRNRAWVLRPGHSPLAVDKVGLTPSEARFFSPGERGPVWDWAGRRYAVAFCREVEDVDLLADAWSDVEVVLWPGYMGWPDDGESAAEALSTGLHAAVVQCNWPGGLNPVSMPMGGSQVWDRRGRLVAALPRDRAGVWSVSTSSWATTPQ